MPALIPALWLSALGEAGLILAPTAGRASTSRHAIPWLSDGLTGWVADQGLTQVLTETGMLGIH